MKKKWICTVCGYVHEGDEAPEFCPQCKQPKSKFKEMVVSDPVAQYKQDLANNNSGIKVSASYDGKQSTNTEFENFVKKEFYKFLKLHNNPIEFGDLWIK